MELLKKFDIQAEVLPEGKTLLGVCIQEGYEDHETQDETTARCVIIEIGIIFFTLTIIYDYKTN